MSAGSVLVIKLGALGDFVQALGPLAAIRAQHPRDNIILLTTRPYVEFAEASGYVNTVWLDSRPKLFEINKWRSLRRWLRRGKFRRIYDLQTSDRSSFYFKLFYPDKPPAWSGIARGCSHPHDNPNRNAMHTIDRQREQLTKAGVRMAGFDDIANLDLSWATADVEHLSVPERFALLVPGGAQHRPAKRWPLENYKALAAQLAERGVIPVLIGGPDEQATTHEIAAAVPSALDLADKTDLLQLAELGRRAEVAIGNDTGPMHLIAAVGAPSVVLYSDESDPALCGQRGKAVTIVRRPSLAELSVEDVLGTLAI
ncbi:MAG: glycosyltransferase family 9 protein [Rhodospirillaceae bacterium]|nr:glycosyltransferase family 9 protein [Rhodospirillaceae bacterium]